MLETCLLAYLQYVSEGLCYSPDIWHILSLFGTSTPSITWYGAEQLDEPWLSCEGYLSSGQVCLAYNAPVPEQFSLSKNILFDSGNTWLIMNKGLKMEVKAKVLTKQVHCLLMFASAFKYSLEEHPQWRNPRLFSNNTKSKSPEWLWPQQRFSSAVTMLFLQISS